MASIEKSDLAYLFFVHCLKKKTKQAIKTNQSARVVGCRNVDDVVNYVWMTLEPGLSWGPSVQVFELELT